MQTPSHGMLRDFLAIVIVVVACPLALAGGMTIGCVGQGFSASCAIGTMFVSQVGLIVAGFLAGLSTRGWTGLLLVYVGVMIGMVAILLWTFGLGKVVPLDPVSGVIAAIWFSAPVTIGYGMARLVARIYARGDTGG